MPRGRLRKWSSVFALTPFIALSFAIPFVNRVEPRIIGLPFLLAWIVAWMLLTPPLLYLAYRIDGSR